ncbi:MAG: YwiC-like family protein [Pyrinomonadaceae bacterium]
MASSAKTISPPRNIKLSQIALPTEHGSWGFLLEPLVAALVIAFSGGGIWISIMVIGAFLARRPLQVLVDQRNVRDGTMRSAALRFVALFSFAAAIGLVGALMTSPVAVLIPLALALPLGTFQLYTESTKRGRQLVAEILGSLIMPTSAASIVLADGGTWTVAAAVYLLFAARFVPSILYVRNRLNLEKGKSSNMLVPAVSHIAALILVGLLALAGYLPLLVIPAFVLLLVRSIWGLSRHRKRVKAMKIGVWEIGYGLIVVAALAVGHFFEL